MTLIFFRQENGIKRHLTILVTPQQNGTVERVDKTLLAKIRCMLFTVGIKHSMWGEVFITAAHLINRYPSSMVDFKTPQEMWTNKKPAIAHLRPFGCTAYMQVLHGKLQPRALKCVLIVYYEGVKGHRLLLVQLEGYKLITVWNVTFDENEFTLILH